MPCRLKLKLANTRLFPSHTCSSSGSCQQQSAKCFSTTARHETRQRRSMWMWLSNQGNNFADALPGSTNYLGAYDTQGRLKRTQENSNRTEETEDEELANDEDVALPPERASDLAPFPLNRSFRSQRVTSEGLREIVWTKIMKDGQSVQTVSAELGVEMSRVGAIVRLKEVEKEWARKGRRLARPYAASIMAMLPQTPYSKETIRPPYPHESINDVPMHASTMQQIFHPTSESRRFTREEAARIFDDTLLAADHRVPHPEMTVMETDRLGGMSAKDRVAAAAKRSDEAQVREAAADAKRKHQQLRSIQKIEGKRWDFIVKHIRVDEAGLDGRGQRGTGWRYGTPHMDRKRGQVKIPVKV